MSVAPVRALNPVYQLADLLETLFHIFQQCTAQQQEISRRLGGKMSQDTQSLASNTLHKGVFLAGTKIASLAIPLLFKLPQALTPQLIGQGAEAAASLVGSYFDSTSQLRQNDHSLDQMKRSEVGQKHYDASPYVQILQAAQHASEAAARPSS